MATFILPRIFHSFAFWVKILMSQQTAWVKRFAFKLSYPSVKATEYNSNPVCGENSEKPLGEGEMKYPQGNTRERSILHNYFGYNNSLNK